MSNPFDDPYFELVGPGDFEIAEDLQNIYNENMTEIAQFSDTRSEREIAIDFFLFIHNQDMIVEAQIECLELLWSGHRPH